jgi:hypothetical protein
MAATAHGTLTGGQVTTVTVDIGYGGFEVVNRSLTGTIWVRYDGQDPAPGAAGSFSVLGARAFELRRRGPIEVRLVADAGLDFSVEAA